MYTPNLERNKRIYELWEKGHTVDQISSLTGIPRSTVGYYVRKFNRLAAEGKPVVFPGAHKAPRNVSIGDQMKMGYWRAYIQTMGVRSLDMLDEGQAKELYYILMDLKLIRELGIFAE